MSELGAVILVTGVLSLAFAANAWRPVYRPAPLALVSFFAGWLSAELALHQVAVSVVFVAALVFAGALSSWHAWVGVFAFALSAAILVLAHRRGARATLAVERALHEALGKDSSGAQEAPLASWLAATMPRSHLYLPFPVRRRGVVSKHGIVFHREGKKALRLDVHSTPRLPGEAPRPTLIYVHGGAWMVGYRRYQGLPVMHHLASLGFVCFSIDYRLSPRATFPDHLVDVKRAIAWVREHADEYGVDPSFLMLAGNSAGGHLTSLAALTPNDPEYQPGFEDADTRVSACMPFYGIYDFADRHGSCVNPGLRGLLERLVMKKKLEGAREEYDKASPIARVRADAPPFFVVHGDCDSLAPVGQAREFVKALRAVSRSKVAYAEIEGAQHAFDIFPSPRTAAIVRGVAAFAAHVYGGRALPRVSSRVPAGTSELALEHAPAPEAIEQRAAG